MPISVSLVQLMGNMHKNNDAVHLLDQVKLARLLLELVFSLL